ncbi:SigE family RNA polymerase sigma factor [Streptomyces sp. SID3343]|uniref:SigE family RNA polymerase sigma factor n=1 Tax=Streptomyces sp. SID3343 TaxID=2690260 RepID=UPI00136DBE79|nr:SigE family RNA polymerase sigma factor [Streptomyces sp. SID3343]MYW04552.1 SigE family RNA polymerase sigma factor [Streptomyces sp. SID3343]
MPSGSDPDFLEFAATHSGRLFRTACLLTTGDWHLAEDLLQETLGKLYPKWRKVSRMEWPFAYAHTTLVRTYLAQQRRKSSTERTTDNVPEQAVRAAGDTELRLTLLDGLARLSPRDRAVLVVRYWEDRSVDEAAEMLNLTAGAVRVRSLRALERLRVLLGDQLPELALDRA